MSVHGKAQKGMQGIGPKHAGAGPKSTPYQKGAKAGSGRSGKVSSPTGFRQQGVKKA